MTNLYPFLILTVRSYVPDTNTVAKQEIKRTTFPNGTFSYMVDAFVTPALVVSIPSTAH